MQTVQTVGDLLSALAALDGEKAPIHRHIQRWFRGQPNAAYELKPGVYRTGFPADEAQRLLLERHLSQDFRVFSTQLRSGQEDDARLYFLQQHYGMPTRLLDWTMSPLVGLYFAVSGPADDAGQHDDAAGKLFVMDAYALVQPQHWIDPQTPFGIAVDRHPDLQRAVRRIVGWEDQATFPGFTFPVRPPLFDPRIVLQHGCFTFHVPAEPVLPVDPGRGLHAYEVPAGCKAALRRELLSLRVDAFAVFGDLPALATRLKEAYGVSAARRAFVSPRASAP